MHERTIVERAVQFEPPVLSLEEIHFVDDDDNDDGDGDDDFFLESV